MTDLLYWCSTSLQVRKLQCTGVAFRSLHVEKVVYLYITAHKNVDRYEHNISCQTGCNRIWYLAINSTYFKMCLFGDISVCMHFYVCVCMWLVGYMAKVLKVPFS